MSGLAIRYRAKYFGGAADARLSGSQAIGREMLAALLKHGRCEAITFLIDSAADVQQVKANVGPLMPSTKSAVVRRLAAIDGWMTEETPRVIWEPQPPEASFSWARSRVGTKLVALGGFVHGSCSPAEVSAIRNLVASPVSHIDRLICGSNAVAHMTQTIVDHWSGVIGKSIVGDLVRIQTIPAGVACDLNRPASVEERQQARARLGIPKLADVLLISGWSAVQGEVSPMLAACQRSAERTGHPVYLLVVRRGAQKSDREGFEWKRVASEVYAIDVDVIDDSIWNSADVFVSLACGVREGPGPTVAQAMSRRLAVVTCDWGDWRETVQHGESGLLVPTTMRTAGCEQALSDLHEGRLAYGQFHAAFEDNIDVSMHDVGQSVERLLSSPQDRQGLSNAAHEYAINNLDWPKIIQRYEVLWGEQHRLLLLQQGENITSRSCYRPGQPTATKSPSRLNPELHDLFAQHPTTWSEADETHLPGSSPESCRVNVTCDAEIDMTFATTCMGRLEHLRQTLPRMVAQPGCHVVLTDYSCPDRSGQWARENFSAGQVTVVAVPGRTKFDRSEAKNAAIMASTTPWICVIDADVIVDDAFATEIRARRHPSRFLRCVMAGKGIGGTVVALRNAIVQAGCHDPVFQDWGEEDEDLVDALKFHGLRIGELPARLFQHVPHDDDARTQFHGQQNRNVSWLVNRLYRRAKWDLAMLSGKVPLLEDRRSLYEEIGSRVRQAIAAKTSTELQIPFGNISCVNPATTIKPTLHVDLEIDEEHL